MPHGYVCVRVDSRGTGRSPGHVDHFSPRETRDFYQCIEWAGVQPWSNGNVGLNGISYYAINQWQVASLQPPHLKAMCIWEGAADWYRDMTHHGGILSTFWANWYDMQVKTVQFGLGERGPRSAVTGALVCGDETMSDDELARNRSSFGDDILAHPLDDDYHKARSPDWDKVTVPFLSAANWGGQGLHPRGNFEGFVRAASKGEMAGMPRPRALDAFLHRLRARIAEAIFRFLSQGRSQRLGRNSRKFNCRSATSTVSSSGMRPTGRCLRRSGPSFISIPRDQTLSLQPPAEDAEISFAAMGDGLTFMSQPLTEETEITGPLAANLRISSSTEDADIFAVFRVFSRGPARGDFCWARSIRIRRWHRAGCALLTASSMKPCPDRTAPTTAMTRCSRLQPGRPVDLAIEIWPTSIVVPKGYPYRVEHSRQGLSVAGNDGRETLQFQERTIGMRAFSAR